MKAGHSSGTDSKRSLLLVSLLQFGTHTDTTKYCEYLRAHYDVTYLCIDHGLPRKVLDGVEVIYCQQRPLGKVELGLLFATLRLVKQRAFDLVFMRRWKFCFVVRLLFPRIPMVMDIRSGSVEEGAIERAIEDSLIWFNSLFFRHVTVISAGLARRLKLPRAAHVVPLGADPAAALTRRPANQLRLLYVGTFKNRRLELTIEGLRRYLDGSDGARCTYTLIGFGPERDVERLLRAVRDHRLEGVVEIRERVDHDALDAILVDHDVGVGFTPREPWFEHQPSTKIFEYLAFGLLCIATDSAANREVITSQNGALIEASPSGFCTGLQTVADALPFRDPRAVAETVRGNSWSRIVHDNLLPYLDRLIQSVDDKRRGAVPRQQGSGERG